MPQLDDIRQRLGDPLTRQKALVDVGEWVTSTCLLMGASASTAHLVGATFLDGLESGERPKERRVIRRRKGRT